MSTRTATAARPIEVPNLVGYKADEAIRQLRELGLMPVAWSAAVDDVKEAGFVLGLEPPASSKVRAKTLVTLSVATHPDFKGHVEAGLDARTDTPIQPPLAWPLSGPTGLAEPHSETEAEPLDEPSPTAAAPDAASAPASPPLDAAYRELRPDAARSSVQPMASGAAAASDLLDLSAAVPTPDELAADAEWDRLRAAEAARHANQQRPSNAQAAPDATSEATVVADKPEPLEPDRDLEEQARCQARRRSARRYRRLTGKQKLIVGAVLALTGLLVLAAASNHKPAGRGVTVARGSAARRRAGRAHAAAAQVPHDLSSAPPRRVVVIRTRTVTVTTPAPTAHHISSPPAGGGAGTASSNPPATSAPAAETSAGTGYQAGLAPFPKPASNPTSADSRSSGTGGGSTLQSPDGATAPPQP